MVKRAIGGVDRDYLLLEYKGDDKLYVPSDQIDAVRHYTGGESPTLNRLGGDGWAAIGGRGSSRRVHVDIPTQRVHVDYDETRVDVERMKTILEEEDYPVTSVG
jgi:copper chaperone CopZ